MIVRAIDAGIDQWIAPRVTPPRSEGQHVSVILTDMLKSLPGRKYEGWGKKRGDDEREPRWEAGYAWEDVLAKALADRHVDEQGVPVEHGELALDNIFGTPDRLFAMQDEHGYRLVDEEAKFTWMSCKELLRDPDKRPEKIEDWKPEGLLSDIRFTYWLLQGKTYAAMLHILQLVPVWKYTEHIAPGASEPAPIGESMRLSARGNDDMIRTPLVRLRAMFINGAYRDALAIPAAFELEYTAEELELWWRVVRNHAAAMAMRESQPDAPPAF